jgi:hypothetical protein
MGKSRAAVMWFGEGLCGASRGRRHVSKDFRRAERNSQTPESPLASGAPDVKIKENGGFIKSVRQKYSSISVLRPGISSRLFVYWHFPCIADPGPAGRIQRACVPSRSVSQRRSS